MSPETTKLLKSAVVDFSMVHTILESANTDCITTNEAESLILRLLLSTPELDDATKFSLARFIDRKHLTSDLAKTLLKVNTRNYIFDQNLKEKLDSANSAVLSILSNDSMYYPDDFSSAFKFLAKIITSCITKSLKDISIQDYSKIASTYRDEILNILEESSN